MSQLANASATSLNFIGFEDVQGQGMPELLYNQVFIEPNRSYTAGVGQLAAAGFVPGTQSYLKRRRAIWSQSSVGKQLGADYGKADRSQVPLGSGGWTVGRPCVGSGEAALVCAGG